MLHTLHVPKACQYYIVQTHITKGNVCITNLKMPSKHILYPLCFNTQASQNRMQTVTYLSHLIWLTNPLYISDLLLTVDTPQPGISFLSFFFFSATGPWIFCKPHFKTNLWPALFLLLCSGAVVVLSLLTSIMFSLPMLSELCWKLATTNNTITAV